MQKTATAWNALIIAVCSCILPPTNNRDNLCCFHLEIRLSHSVLVLISLVKDRTNKFAYWTTLVVSCAGLSRPSDEGFAPKVVPMLLKISSNTIRKPYPTPCTKSSYVISYYNRQDIEMNSKNSCMNRRIE